MGRRFVRLFAPPAERAIRRWRRYVVERPAEWSMARGRTFGLPEFHLRIVFEEDLSDHIGRTGTHRCTNWGQSSTMSDLLVALVAHMLAAGCVCLAIPRAAPRPCRSDGMRCFCGPARSPAQDLRVQHLRRGHQWRQASWRAFSGQSVDTSPWPERDRQTLLPGLAEFPFPLFLRWARHRNRSAVYVAAAHVPAGCRHWAASPARSSEPPRQSS
jgi:hypothetical protein